MGHNHIGSEHCLLGLIREGDGTAVRVLEDLGVDLSAVRAIVMEKLAAESTELAGPVWNFFSKLVSSMGIQWGGLQVFN